MNLKGKIRQMQIQMIIQIRYMIISKTRMVNLDVSILVPNIPQKIVPLKSYRMFNCAACCIPMFAGSIMIFADEVLINFEQLYLLFFCFFVVKNNKQS